VRCDPLLRSLTKIAGKPYDRLSDDGKLAVLDHGKVGWAETSTIASSNAVLDARHSKVKIEAMGAGDVAVAPPSAAAGAPTTTLKQFHIIDRVTSSEVELTDDCGTANQEILGADHDGSQELVAAHKNGTPVQVEGDLPVPDREGVCPQHADARCSSMLARPAGKPPR